MKDNVWIFDCLGKSNQIRTWDFSETVAKVAEALYTMSAVWIRGLETYSKELNDYCKQISAANCHVILSPGGSQVLGLHKDEWDVLVKMLYGHRVYFVEGKKIELHAGEELLIKKGHYHQVFCPVDAVTINYGISEVPTNAEMITRTTVGVDLFNHHEFFMRWSC